MIEKNKCVNNQEIGISIEAANNIIDRNLILKNEIELFLRLTSEESCYRSNCIQKNIEYVVDEGTNNVLDSNCTEE
ncbi:hypothetical protein [Bacillus carboniphilus]|uniref:hypothetical protein n=1 Tax=Bacillus carboniphilus TaxID=86663 RepID=UPI001CFA8975